MISHIFETIIDRLIMSSFSKRYNYREPDKEITIREDAPIDLREYVVALLYSLGYSPSRVRRIICIVLKRLPDSDNWSENPNIDMEVRDLINGCSWYYVYDIIEAFAQQKDISEQFSEEINYFFHKNGIGWKLENRRIEYRGGDTFERVIADAEHVLESNGFHTAKQEITEAINDMSRKPSPDFTGAIQHSLASLECACRYITDESLTLGALISKYPRMFPSPLDKTIHTIWGYSSNYGRHLQEGNPPNYLESELIVHLCAALCQYIAKTELS